MNEFKGTATRIETLIEVLKAETKISIWDSEQQKMLFDGAVYQLYDNSAFDSFYIKEVNISFNRISVLIANN